MEKSQFVAHVANFASQHALWTPHARLLVALSGGADSVALLLTLRQLGLGCVAAHCNFHLRGDESERDEHFVRSLCDRLGVPVQVVHFDVEAYRRQHGVSVEMACRELRYAWFEQQRCEQGCADIAVAHHADDNVETLILNLLRSTGLAGLTGMKPRNGHIVRPLLCVTRQQVEDFLAQQGQQYVVDSTNRELDYKRNRVRNVLLPALDAVDPAARQALLATMEHVGQARELYDDLLDMARRQVVTTAGSVTQFSRQALAAVPHSAMLLYELLKAKGFNRRQCEQALTAAVGSSFAAGHYVLEVGREMLVLSEAPAVATGHLVDWDNLSSLPASIALRRVRDSEFQPSLVDGRRSIALDSRVLGANAVLRPWRQGDRMTPFGMRGSKLVSDIFADAKLDAWQKRQQWILEVDGTIVWLLGLRAAADFAVSPQCRDYIVLTCED